MCLSSRWYIPPPQSIKTFFLLIATDFLVTDLLFRNALNSRISGLSFAVDGLDIPSPTGFEPYLVIIGFTLYGLFFNFCLTNEPFSVFRMKYVKFNRITRFTYQARIINCSFSKTLLCKERLSFSFQGTESLCVNYLSWSYRILVINASMTAIEMMIKQVFKSRFIILLSLFH